MGLRESLFENIFLEKSEKTEEGEFDKAEHIESKVEGDFRPKSEKEFETHFEAWHTEEERVRAIREHVKRCVAKGVCPVCSIPAEVSGFCSDAHYKVVHNRISPTLSEHSDLSAEVYYDEHHGGKQETDKALSAEAVVQERAQKEEIISSTQSLIESYIRSGQELSEQLEKAEKFLKEEEALRISKQKEVARLLEAEKVAKAAIEKAQALASAQALDKADLEAERKLVEKIEAASPITSIKTVQPEKVEKTDKSRESAYLEPIED
ncbi:MAG: hypothetical protein PHT88_05380 [Candidatus Moranbacteria bacterium]|nr:hypothetical protein [Candidatus Moranbacteria bacterium]